MFQLHSFGISLIFKSQELYFSIKHTLLTMLSSSFKRRNKANNVPCELSVEESYQSEADNSVVCVVYMTTQPQKLASLHRKSECYPHLARVLLTGITVDRVRFDTNTAPDQQF